MLASLEYFSQLCIHESKAELAVRATRYPQYNGALILSQLDLGEEIPLTLHGTGV